MSIRHIAAMGALAAWPMLAIAESAVLETTFMWTPPSGKSGEIVGSHAALLTTPEGAAMRLESNGYEPGHVVTVWFVAIQAPENCTARPCPPTDAMGRSDKVDSVAALGGSAVVDNDGRIAVGGFMPVGRVASNFFETELTKPETAEFHLAVHDHGPVIPEAIADMLTTYRGGCTDASIPPYYPAVATSFGTPGPNDCKTVQVAIFMQDGAAMN